MIDQMTCHIREALAHALAISMARRGVNLSTVAQKAGLSRTSLYATFNRSSPPSITLLNKIAAAIGYRVTVSFTPIQTAIASQPKTQVEERDLLRLRARRGGQDALSQLCRIHPGMAHLVPDWPTDQTVRKAISDSQGNARLAAKRLQVPDRWMRQRIRALGLVTAYPERKGRPITPLSQADITDIIQSADSLVPYATIAARYGRSPEGIRQIILKHSGMTHADRISRERRALIEKLPTLLAKHTDFDALISEATTNVLLTRTDVCKIVIHHGYAWAKRLRQEQAVSRQRQRDAIAKRLAEAMQARGISRRMLASSVGITACMIGHILCGRASSRHLASIADHLRVSQDWLSNGIGPMDVGPGSEP